ncbi:hypothetical protein M0R04_11170 [Candidatus Dojkabacteria bacterium]|jgi:hypothetical protein|nr:hypothetical protein [Candidatus Dojkabacteria bacterium]
MVKFMIKGDNKTTVRMCGHGYTGGVVYDNDFCRLPLEVIKPYIIGEAPKAVVKAEEPIEDKPIEKVWTAEELFKLNKAEQVALLKEKGLTDKEIKLLSTEKMRIERILLL